MMEDLFGTLIKRIRDKDPMLTPQELEKEIANCVGMEINEIIQQIVTNGPVKLLKQTIRETLSLACEVTPALSLYVHVGNTSDQKTSIESFSSFPFEEALAMIAEKDFSVTPPREILDFINGVINQASESFIHNVLFSHPLLTKIFQQFVKTFHEQPNIILHDPVIIFTESEYVKRKEEAENDGHCGTYL